MKGLPETGPLQEGPFLRLTELHRVLHALVHLLKRGQGGHGAAAGGGHGAHGAGEIEADHHLGGGKLVRVLAKLQACGIKSRLKASQKAAAVMADALTVKGFTGFL